MKEENPAEQSAHELKQLATELQRGLASIDTLGEQLKAVRDDVTTTLSAVRRAIAALKLSGKPTPVALSTESMRSTANFDYIKSTIAKYAGKVPPFRQNVEAETILQIENMYRSVLESVQFTPRPHLLWLALLIQSDNNKVSLDDYVTQTGYKSSTSYTQMHLLREELALGDKYIQYNPNDSIASLVDASPIEAFDIDVETRSILETALLESGFDIIGEDMQEIIAVSVQRGIARIHQAMKSGGETLDYTDLKKYTGNTTLDAHKLAHKLHYKLPRDLIKKCSTNNITGSIEIRP